MTLARAVAVLGWPDETSILDPSGEGPAVNVALARKKVGHSLTELEGGHNAQVGVLSADPEANTTEAPLALVCAFQQQVPESTISEIHRLAWNFCRTPLLLTVDTERLRAFTCCEPPAPPQTIHELPAELREASYHFGDELQHEPSLVDEASHSLHWLELVSGRLFKKNEQRFSSSKRADVLLLSNLHIVRNRLHNDGLDYDVIHDLLARIIFIQFLFDRRDSDGQTALNPNYLARLHRSGVLSRSYRNLTEILANHEDCYNFFWYLDDRFNGDLFPEPDGVPLERSEARDSEKSLVKSGHLQILSHFVSGRMEMTSGQLSLWPSYSFDIIPLEFISSIYETFVTKKTGTVYTPAHLVDFVLDGVLPWKGVDWNLRILDPACGSGIFLVKAYQRLIHRWKNANPDQRIPSAVLRSLLEGNLFGVDNDSHAVRTASFSLYLAMCDEIEPRYYWTQVRFPSLRNRSLLARDFFDEDTSGIHTEENDASYDIVVGNAPWGRNSATCLSLAWARKHRWRTSYGDIGPLFLAKSASLVKTDGKVSLIQPGSTLLFNHSSPARETRERIFYELTVTEVVNLSALRFGLFRKSVGPAVIVTLLPGRSTNQTFQYICPKPARYSGSDDFRITIDRYDVHDVLPHEAVTMPIVWSALIWGGRRDVALLERLSRLATIGKYKRKRRLTTRQGIYRGKKEVERPAILGKRILRADEFPEDVFLQLSPLNLEINSDPFTHEKDSTNFEAFEPLQLLVKMAWTIEEGRYRAVMVTPSTEGVLCTRHYISVHAAEEDREILESACLSYNSAVAVYYLFLRSGRFANYRPEPYVWELLDVPIPNKAGPSIGEITCRKKIEEVVEELFEFRPAERVLIEDALKYALADFKGDSVSPGRSPTDREAADGRPQMLDSYCDWFLRVLKAGFGVEKDICATVYVEDAEQRLPVRMVAFHLGIRREMEVLEEPIAAGNLAEQLKRIYGMLVDNVDNTFSFRRIARVFDVWTIGGRSIPTVLVVKPDEARYWTRSVAMRDADEVSSEILQRMHAADGRLKGKEH